MLSAVVIINFFQISVNFCQISISILQKLSSYSILLQKCVAGDEPRWYYIEKGKNNLILLQRCSNIFMFINENLII